MKFFIEQSIDVSMFRGRQQVWCLLLILLSLFSQGCIDSNIESGDDIDDISLNQLHESLWLSQRYLMRMMRPDGSFVYVYDPSTDTFSSEYNMLRHAGTCYALVKLYDYFNVSLILPSVERGLAFLGSKIEPFFGYRCVISDNEVKLGGNALAVVALVEYMQVTGDLSYLPLAQDLARFIVYAQNDSGGFVSKYDYPSGEPSDFQSDYYPGEAILALTRLYQLDGNQSWIDAAENAALYLIDNQVDDVSECSMAQDHWLLISLNELYRVRPHPVFLSHSWNISFCILSNQRGSTWRTAEKEEWMGSFYTPPRSASTATFTEGLIASYNLLHDFTNDTDHVKMIRKGIILGIGFQLKTQFDNETVSVFPDSIAKLAVGGFYHSLDDYHIRIDYIQHNVCSILGYYDILLNKI